MASINGFQLGLGALLKGPEIIRDWNSIRNDYNAREALGALGQFSSSREARDFDPAAVGYLDPNTLMKINDLRADKVDSLLRREAAPVQAESTNLLNMARVDPFVGSEEGRRDFAERPEFWLRGSNTGAVTGAKGTTPESAGNPYESQALQQFARENANVLNAFRASEGDRMAGANIATDKDLAGGFHNVQQGASGYSKTEADAAARISDKNLAGYYANTPYDPRQHATWMEGAARTGASVDEIQKLSKHLMDRNSGIVAEYRDVVVQQGPNTTRERVAFNAYGQPIPGQSTQSTNNPSDRELGIGIGGGGGDNARVDVSWIADGIANSASVRRSDLPAFKKSLEAQGVTEVSTIDGKRASRTERLIKEQKRSRRERFAPPGAAATPTPVATGGGYTYMGGKLVKN